MNSPMMDGELWWKTAAGYTAMRQRRIPPPAQRPRLEDAVAEVTKEELKVNTLAIMKKVAFSLSTVIGGALI